MDERFYISDKTGGAWPKTSFPFVFALAFLGLLGK